jgi:hypothetical protein
MKSHGSLASAFGRHTARIVRPSGTTTSIADLTIQVSADFSGSMKTRRPLGDET